MKEKLESKAEKMFKELGYIESVFNHNGDLVYEGNKGRIVFIESIKHVQVPIITYDIAEHSYKLYVAIYKKIKELGWLDD